MKKIIALLMGLTVIVSAFTACGEKNNSSESDNMQSTSSTESDNAQPTSAADADDTQSTSDTEEDDIQPISSDTSLK